MALNASCSDRKEDKVVRVKGEKGRQREGEVDKGVHVFLPAISQWRWICLAAQIGCPPGTEWCPDCPVLEHTAETDGLWSAADDCAAMEGGMGGRTRAKTE